MTGQGANSALSYRQSKQSTVRGAGGRRRLRLQGEEEEEERRIVKDILVLYNVLGWWACGTRVLLSQLGCTGNVPLPFVFLFWSNRQASPLVNS